jgi:hypothetical protein
MEFPDRQQAAEIWMPAIPAAEDELRLTCGARWRLLIAASFRT